MGGSSQVDEEVDEGHVVDLLVLHALLAVAVVVQQPQKGGHPDDQTPQQTDVARFEVHNTHLQLVCRGVVSVV